MSPGHYSLVNIMPLGHYSPQIVGGAAVVMIMSMVPTASCSAMNLANKNKNARPHKRGAILLTGENVSKFKPQ